MDPLSRLLDLSASEKAARGLEHTPREIAQQPATWNATFKHLQPQRKNLQDFLAKVGITSAPQERPTVFLTGAGTSDYIGQSLHSLLRTKWRCEVIPVASTNLLIDFPEYVLDDKHYLWLSFSRSGDSPEGVAVLERALAEFPNISHILITCNGSGQMNKAVQGHSNCFPIVLDRATNDMGLAMTSSFTNMVLTGQILAHAWALEEYESILQALIRAAEELLPRAAVLAEELAQAGCKRACFVGSSVLAGAALECSLKLLELTAGKVQTMTESTLALRHGPMAALDRDTLFVSFVSGQSQRRKYEVDLLREVGNKNLAGTRVAVTTDPDELQADADYVLAPQTPASIPDLYRPVLDVIFGQLLGLFASINCGLKPDTPSPEGVISRVVQNVGIHE